MVLPAVSNLAKPQQGDAMSTTQRLKSHEEEKVRLSSEVSQLSPPLLLMLLEIGKADLLFPQSAQRQLERENERERERDRDGGMEGDQIESSMAIATHLHSRFLICLLFASFPTFYHILSLWRR